MLPPAALIVADRLIATLMTLVDAVADIAIDVFRTPASSGDGPDHPLGHAAPALAFRLVNLITTLIGISAFGIRAPREPNPGAPSHTSPASTAPATRDPSLPRRPGWLLAALPGIAPAIAADLGLLLADPAFAILLGAAPGLDRAFRPLLRALGLTVPQSPGAPPPKPAPSRAPPNAPPPAAPPRGPQPRKAKPPRRNRPYSPAQHHVHFVTIS